MATHNKGNEMNLSQAKDVAIQTANVHKQMMHVVSRGDRYFAASNLDMQRQFLGMSPVFTYTPRKLLRSK